MSPAGANYVELQVTTHFSFLRGASSADELFAAAALLGLPALGIADRNSLAGIVRAYDAAKATGVRLIVGSRLDLTCGTSLLVYPTDRAAYGRLCRLLSIGKSRAGKGDCHLDWNDVVAYGDGLIAILVPDEADDMTATRLRRLRRDFGDRTYLALTLRRRPGDALRLHELSMMAAAAHVPAVATGDVLYHAPARRILQDVVTCIREGCTIDDAGFRRERFADRHLKAPEEMARLFRSYPDALARTQEIAERCRFSLDELKYQYPAEVCIPGLTPQQALEKLAWEGVAWRYPDGASDAVERQLRHELGLIERLNYAPYFLTVHSIVRYAISEDILCQGRGSAANSVVCFVLGITSIDPVKSDLLFERFVSAERNEPPDIDVDFESGRREEVIQWIYKTYGRDRAALCATVSRYRARGAIRDVGKALGLPEDMIKALGSQVWGWSSEGVREKDAEALNLDTADYRLRLTLDLARQLMGVPRHLSQHPGGFVLTHDRLDDLVPIEPAAMDDRQVIEWDKDDIDALGFMKVDVLGLGMLGCMRRAFELLAEHKGEVRDLASIPQDDEPTYAMIQKADTVGVFQIESRAQMSMLPRLKPAEFYDLVIEVAIVRPGPIQGDMVHPYLRRREGREKPSYPSPELRGVLEKTLGVPLFQEQAMKVAIVGAGFTPDEADQLRRSMATFKHTGGVSKFRDKLINGMVRNGYDLDFAERTFKQIEGFGSYGFPESHAMSFAQIAYASSWMKCHHPDVFLAAILNSQPMGFYAPAQLVRDAREHGVEVRAIDINHSRWDCMLEPCAESRGGFAVRLGMRMTKGLSDKHAADIITARMQCPFAGIEELRRRVAVPVAALEALANANAFRSVGLGRREALWAIRGLSDEPLPLFAAADRYADRIEPEAHEPSVALVPMTAGSEVVEDYRSHGLSLVRHPVAFLRDDLSRMGIVPAEALRRTRDGRAATVAGIILLRQRPGSASGVMFMTIEDETAHANIVIWQQLFEKERRLILSSRMVAIQGRVQREGEVIHLVAHKFTDLTPLLDGIGRRGELPVPTGRGDEARHGGGPDRRDGLGRRVGGIYIPDPRPDSGIKVPTRDFR